MEAIILELAQKHPGLLSAFAIIGVLRAIFKPMMVVLEAYVDATPSKADDGWLAKFKAGKVYAGIAFILDYAASIKLPK
jgi:hypothetical protein